jgi:hypothetical protein
MRAGDGGWNIPFFYIIYGFKLPFVVYNRIWFVGDLYILRFTAISFTLIYVY